MRKMYSRKYQKMYSRSHKRGIIRHSLKNCQENYYLVLALSGTRVTASQFITGLPQRCDQYSNKCEQSDAQKRISSFQQTKSVNNHLWISTFTQLHKFISSTSVPGEYVSRENICSQSVRKVYLPTQKTYICHHGEYVLWWWCDGFCHSLSIPLLEKQHFAFWQRELLLHLWSI